LQERIRQKRPTCIAGTGQPIPRPINQFQLEHGLLLKATPLVKEPQLRDTIRQIQDNIQRVKEQNQQRREELAREELIREQRVKDTIQEGISKIEQEISPIKHKGV
jgi:hypothetical protein